MKKKSRKRCLIFPIFKTKKGFIKIDLDKEKVIIRISYRPKKGGKRGTDEIPEENEVLVFSIEDFCQAISLLKKAGRADLQTSKGIRRVEFILERQKSSTRVRINFHLKKAFITFFVLADNLFSIIPPPRYFIIFQIPAAVENIIQLTHTWIEKVWSRDFQKAFLKAENLRKTWEPEIKDYLHYVILPSHIIRLEKVMKFTN